MGTLPNELFSLSPNISNTIHDELLHSIDNIINLYVNQVLNTNLIKNMNIFSNLLRNGFDVGDCNHILENIKLLEKQILLQNTNVNNSDFTNISLLDDNKIKKILGDKIHDIYNKSGYHIYIYNMPEYGIIKPIANTMHNSPTNLDADIPIGEQYIKIDSAVIYDTINYFADNDIVLSVFQVNKSNYLIKLMPDKYHELAKICKLLNNTIVDKNIIHVDEIKIDNTNNINNNTNTTFNASEPIIHSVNKCIFSRYITYLSISFTKLFDNISIYYNIMRNTIRNTFANTFANLYSNKFLFFFFI
jgi:hypothetical protein